MPPRYIQLESNDNFKFVITREAAMVSGTLRGMLNSEQFEEAQTGRLKLDMTGQLLAKVCDYFYYNLKYNEGDGKFEVPPALALELLVAADYLNT